MEESDESPIRVNFGRPMPVFPLDQTVLLPQQVMPLHIFEPRYVQMIEHALDGPGQLAMGVFAGDRWKHEYHGVPPIRPAVCVGQIVQHERLADGRYNILLQGVCRAQVVDESPPDEDHQYRTATLAPVGETDEGGEDLDDLRDWLDEEITSGPLSRLSVAAQVCEYVRNEDVPTPLVLDLVAFAMLTDPKVRYRLLAEGDAHARARLIRDGLEHVGSIIRRAELQRPEQWPKGMSWN